MRPSALVVALRRQRSEAKRMHERDMAAGHDSVWLPDALARKFRNGARGWRWQWRSLARPADGR